MIELKVYTYDDMLDGVANVDIEYYPKSEADKVIAEKDAEIAKLKESVKGLILDNYLKDKEIAELKKQVHDYAQGLYVIQARAEKEIRRQKYKRCLAMKKMCQQAQYKYSMLSQFESIQINSNPKAYKRYDSKFRFYLRWRKRWLELAKKFKTNSTAQ